MKKNLFSLICTSVLVSGMQAATLNLSDGWNLISIPSSTTIAKSSLTFSDMGTFNGTAPIPSFLITDLVDGKGYWLQSSGSATITYTEKSTIKIPFLGTGWNLIGLPEYANISSFQTAMTSLGYSYSDIGTFNGTAPIPSFLITSIDKNKGYWVNVSAIDYSIFIVNALTADTNLTSISSQNDLNSKSIITAQNVSNELKFYLTTINSDTSYKKVVLTNFKSSELNSDINSSTLNATDLAQTTGWCGSFVVDSSNSLTITSVDDESNSLTDSTTSYATTYGGADGNLTINGSYSKVVWSGTAISLAGVNNCQISGFPTGVIDPISEFSPPSIPN